MNAGGCSIFVASEPLARRRYLEVREQRTRKEWAAFVRELIDVHYPQAEKIVLVMDNLNTQSCLLLRGVRASRSLATQPETGDPLHADARQLAEHG